MGGLSGLGILVVLALRSIWSHKVKSLIVGGLIFFGTFLVVLGSSLLDSVERSMQRSIVSSLAGHLQVYSADAKDDLALFGGGLAGAEDIGRMRQFGPVKKALLEVDNVEAVVPMGLGDGMVTQPGELDRTLTKLRDAVREGRVDRYPSLTGHVRQIAKGMRAEKQKDLAVTSRPEEIEEALGVIDRALSDAFWAGFEGDPLGHLEYLDTKLAPLSEDGKLVYMRYLGTDLDAFAQHFDRFRIVEGEPVPSGRRGILLARRVRETWLKNRVAATLDEINEAYETSGRRGGVGPLVYDEGLADKAKRLPKQYPRITYELDPEEAKQLDAKLAEILPEVEGGLDAKVQAFLAVTDENFEARYAQFYEHIAVLLDLYLVDVGEVITLRAVTQSGYLKAINVPVYGVFQFEGLEKSDLAGAQNLVDIVTFRELYGVMTEGRKAELLDIKEEVGVEDVAAADAEAALFGGGADPVAADADTTGFDEFAGVDLSSAEAGVSADTFSLDEVDAGLALNAAVILRDPASLEATAAAITAKSQAEGLGLKVVDWQEAAGILGQFMWVIRAVLYIAIGIIFLVALFIINNSMVIATMERVAEIGTMRAIGAQKGFVLTMFLVETLVLGFISGALGTGAGVWLVTVLGSTGIPAGGQDILVLLFSGPRLFPTVGAAQIVLGFVLLTVVSVISTLYPALLAIRVQPVVAMQTGSE